MSVLFLKSVALDSIIHHISKSDRTDWRGRSFLPHGHSR